MDAAIVVHRELGPGLLETVYVVVLLDEKRKRGFSAERQVPIAIVCRGVRFDEGFPSDIIVESKVTIELKSVERINNAYKKQLLTYLKITGMKLGYLLNFGEDMRSMASLARSTACQNKKILAILAALREKNEFEQVTSADGVPLLSSSVQYSRRLERGETRWQL